MSIPKIALDLGSADPVGVYCPVCGRAIFAPKVDGYCPHVAFAFLDIVGEFSHVAPHVQAVIDTMKAENEEQGIDDFEVEELIEHLESKSMFGLIVTSYGMACGPTSSTVMVGIDYLPPV